MTNTEKVFAWLEDEQSKFIYKKRVEYNETHDFTAIQEIVDKYLPQLKDKKYYPGIERELIEKVKDKRKIAVFGTGTNGAAVVNLLRKADLKADVLLDNDANKWGKEFYGLLVSAPEKMDYTQIDAIIITPYADAWIEAIKGQLTGYGAGEEKIFLYKDYCPYMLEEEQYFDENIIRLEEEEVFIDGGVLDLATSLSFCNVCKKNGVKNYKVHAFEPDEKSFARCQEILRKNPNENITIYPVGLWKENTTLCFDEKGNGASRITQQISETAVSVAALDKWIDSKVTFIKMDIEGAELAALRGAKGIIQKQKPKLAICIYHKEEDMTEIPMYLKELVPEYKLYVRHYSNDAGETVLYAVL